MSSPPRSRGAYGFTLRGVDAAHDLLVPAPDSWPPLQIVWREDEGALRDYDLVHDDYAELALADGGWVSIEGDAARVTFVCPRRPSDSELIHPHLASIGAVASRWLGRESFHAGAVMLDGGAWAILGDKEAGKSSMLAWLAGEGCPVISDDLLVLDEGCALAGPRSIDLRASAAEALGIGEPLGRVGTRDRFRVMLGPVAPSVPLHGWIVLAWHDGAPELRPVRGAQRLHAIVPHRAVHMLPGDPAALVELSALPCYELRRSREWASLGDAGRELVSATYR